MKIRKNPQKRDPEKTQANILDHAIRAFARAGFNGVGLSEICEKAGVNKRMIYHYFKDKDGLYKAVHRQGWKELEEGLLKELSPSEILSSLSTGIEGLLLEAVEIFYDFIASHQIFLRLLLWDGLEGGRASKSLWKEVRGPIFRQIEGLIQAAQERGVLSADLKASHLIVSFIGAISFYFSHAHTMGDIFLKNPLSPEAVTERKEQVLGLFKKALQSPEGS